MNDKLVMFYEDCPTRGRGRARTRCQCEPPCAICGYNKHEAIHGPELGKRTLWPGGHYYEPSKNVEKVTG